MENNIDSWKQKVDPAFVKFIQIWLNFLKVIHLPDNEGYIAVDAKSLGILGIEGFPSLASVYEYDETKDVVSDFDYLIVQSIAEKEAVESGKEIGKEIAREIKKKKGFIFKKMLELSEIMENESRGYYKKAFDNFISEEMYNEYISEKDENQIKDILKRMTSDIRSFWFNWLVIPLEDAKEEIRKSIAARHIKASTRMIKRNLFYTWDAVSLLVNGASLRELFRKAKEGDNESLFKIIKIDKTFFDHKWVRTRINKASYSGDWNFFESLGEAIKEEPLKHDSRAERIDKLFIVIKFFWNFGLNRLSDYELHDLLINEEIAGELGTHENVESFIKFMQRHRSYLPK
jgi:hypothetical protein